MTVTSRSVTVRDFAIFQLKLFLDGFKDLVAFNLSIIAIILDFISGRGKRPRLFYSVVRASERFDKWINLHSVLEVMDERDSEEGLFGGNDEGDDSLVAEIEKMVKKSGREGAKAIGPLKEKGAELKKTLLDPPKDEKE